MADPVTEFEHYRQEILTILADDDPVAVLRATLDEVPRLVATASTERPATIGCTSTSSAAD